MNFNRHSDLEGEHAFLGASKYHWINYDDEKLEASYLKFLAIQKGTKLHSFARFAIELNMKLPKTKNAFNQYVNDAIGYRMTPEQILFYSMNSYGTADAISFRDNLLRIHDLKTGIMPVSMSQLKVYASLFCLEYNHKPSEIDIELRIYQEDNIVVETPPIETIFSIMEKIIIFDRKIDKLKEEQE